MRDSSFSVLNRDEFFVEKALVNKGRGRNFGVDFTWERALNKGLYYMITASLFDSRYCGGDGIWHNTRFNRKYVLNGLIGKEWMLGRNKQNILSVNLKLTPAKWRTLCSDRCGSNDGPPRQRSAV